MKRIKFLPKALGLVFGTLLAGLLLLVAVYSLPTGRMKSHVGDSDELFNYEGIYPQVIHGYKASQLDNYTDALMYATAIHPGSGSPVADAMRNARFEYADDNMVQSLNDYANDVSVKDEQRYEMTYARYWHGYLVVLKPLLLLFDVGDIRTLNMILQGGLFAVLLFLIRKRIGSAWQMPVLLMAAVIHPVVLPLSLQYSWVYYVGMTGAVLLLCMKKPAGGRKHLLLFLWLGMATSYMDLLTWPLFTLGLPLALYLIMEHEPEWRKKLGQVVGLSFLWAAGYAVMWAGKWVFSLILGKNNIFAEVLSEIGVRTSLVGEQSESFTALDVLLKNMGVLQKWPYIFLFAGFFAFCIWRIFRIRHAISLKRAALDGIVWLVVFLIPVAWIVLLANHSYIHYWFTYRELAVSVLAAACWLTGISDAKGIPLAKKERGTDENG